MNNSLGLGKCTTGLVAVCLLLSLARGQQVYVAPDSEFRIVFPQGWAVEEGILRAVLVKGMTRDLSDTATITVRKAVDRVGFSEMTPSEVSELTRQQYEGLKYSYVGSGYDSIAGRRTMWIACSVGVSEYTAPRAIITHFFPRDSHVYLVTATVHPRNYERYLSTFRATAASFRPRGEFSPAATRSPGAPVHDDPVHGFSLAIPPGWLVKPSFTEDCVFKVVRRHEGSGSGITVTAVKLDPAASPADRELDTGTMRTVLTSALTSQPQVTDFRMRRIEYDLVSDKRAVRAEHTTTYRDPDGALRRMQSTDLFVVHRDYLLRFSGVLGDESVKEAFATMMQSVRLYGDKENQGATAQPSRMTVVLKKPGEKPLVAAGKAFGSEFLKYFLVFVGLGLVGSIWRVISRKRKNSGSTDDKAP